MITIIRPSSFKKHNSASMSLVLSQTGSVRLSISLAEALAVDKGGYVFILKDDAKNDYYIAQGDDTGFKIQVGKSSFKFQNVQLVNQILTDFQHKGLDSKYLDYTVASEPHEVEPGIRAFRIKPTDKE